MCQILTFDCIRMVGRKGGSTVENTKNELIMNYVLHRHEIYAVSTYILLRMEGKRREKCSKAYRYWKRFPP